MAKGNTGWAHPVSRSAHKMNAQLGQVLWFRKAMDNVLREDTQAQLEFALARAEADIRSQHERFKADYYAKNPKGK